MVNLIHEFVTFLSQANLSASEVISRIGSVEYDPGPPLPVKLQTNIAGISDASLFLYPDTGLPYVLKLRLASRVKLNLGILKKEFHIFERAVSSPETTPKLIFYPNVQNSECKVVLIAELESMTSKIDNAGVISISFRRDLNTTDS
jgi:hypothetical protein